MLTATELLQTEGDRRQRAARYESLLGDRTMLQHKVTSLSKTDNAKSLAYLRQVYEGSGSLVPDLTTRGVGFVAGGFVVRDVLMVTAMNALNDLERKEKQRADELAKAQADLARVEQDLQAFQ